MFIVHITDLASLYVFSALRPCVSLEFQYLRAVSALRYGVQKWMCSRGFDCTALVQYDSHGISGSFFLTQILAFRFPSATC